MGTRPSLVFIEKCRLFKSVVQYPLRVLIKFSMIFDKLYGLSEICLCNFFLLPSSGPWDKNLLYFMGSYTFYFLVKVSLWSI